MCAGVGKSGSPTSRWSVPGNPAARSCTSRIPERRMAETDREGGFIAPSSLPDREQRAYLLVALRKELLEVLGKLTMEGEVLLEAAALECRTVDRRPGRGRQRPRSCGIGLGLSADPLQSEADADLHVL